LTTSISDLFEKKRAMPVSGLSLAKSGSSGLDVISQPNWKKLEKKEMTTTSRKRGASSRPIFCRRKKDRDMVEAGVISNSPLACKMAKTRVVNPCQKVGRYISQNRRVRVKSAAVCTSLLWATWPFLRKSSRRFDDGSSVRSPPVGLSSAIG